MNFVSLLLWCVFSFKKFFSKYALNNELKQIEINKNKILFGKTDWRRLALFINYLVEKGLMAIN